jgi:hypothetical protein
MDKPDLYPILAGLLDWASYMGGFEAEEWRKAEAAAEQYCDARDQAEESAPPATSPAPANRGLPHTPGPWHVEGTCEEGYHCRVGGGDTDIAAVWQLPHERQIESHRNGYLIAAAPELVDACRSALDMPDGVPVAHWNEARATLRAAIAKAEGRGE